MDAPRLPYLVTCGYERSHTAVAFLAEAACLHLQPAAVLVASPRSLAQLRTLARRHGRRGLLRKLAGALRERLRPAPGEHADVVSLCREHGIPVQRCASLNAPEACALARHGGFQWGVYLGGGILRSDFLRSLPGPLLNAHHGPLPRIRGMNAVEWALYEGLPSTVTLHRIDEGIDTGEIYLSRALDLSGAATIEDLRARAAAAGLELLLEGVRLARDGRLAAQPNPPEAGRQYFTMHPYLKAVLEERRRPAVS